jgi:hypothetical protein
MEDRDRDLSLNGFNDTNLNELGFSKVICKLLTKIPFRLLCTSIVTLVNPRTINGNEHLVVTSLMLTNNDKTTTFTKPLMFKFENIVSQSSLN